MIEQLLLDGAPPLEVELPARHHKLWTTVTAIEVAAACAAIAADLAVPSIVLLLMAVISLLVRRDHWSSLGFHKGDHSHLARRMLAFASVWSLFQLGVTMPIANHVSGTAAGPQRLQGPSGKCRRAGRLAAPWLDHRRHRRRAGLSRLPANPHATAVRQQRSRARCDSAVVIDAVRTVHSEQGLIGMVIVTIDGVAWSVLRYRYKTLWASVLAHGFNNTIGFIAFFLVGPIHGFW